jgi:hypothetical protein
MRLCFSLVWFVGMEGTIHSLGSIPHLLVGARSAKDSHINRKIWARQCRSRVGCSFHLRKYTWGCWLPNDSTGRPWPPAGHPSVRLQIQQTSVGGGGVRSSTLELDQVNWSTTQWKTLIHRREVSVTERIALAKTRWGGSA